MNVNGGMVYWRFKRDTPCEWRFGYTTNMPHGLIRMGRWNGDTTGGVVVSKGEIEWKPWTN